MPDLTLLRHPSERSRLVLAVAASVGLIGLAAVLFFKRLEREQVIWTMVVGPAAVLLGWAGLQILRANLLGNAVKATPESLPELHAVLDDVRARLAYDRRVDVYVTDRVDGLMTLTSLFGTRIILIEGDLLAALLKDGKRAELTFLIARFFGALKSQRDRIAPLRFLVTLARPVGIVDPLIWPYDRAVVYSGDQIGLAVCGDLESALNALDRLLVGGSLGPMVSDAGVVDQARQARRRTLPRVAQLVRRQPHLANRYVNLMAFAERRPAPQPARRRVLTPVAGALATTAAIAAAALLLPPGGMEPAVGDPGRHAKLIAHVPASFAGSCVPGEDVLPAVRRDLRAAVVCTAGAPAAVDYYEYEDRAALDAAFDRLVKGTEDAGCAGPYDEGRVACWQTKEANVLAWTDERTRILSLAVSRDMQPGELLRWWQRDSGPT